MMGSAHEPGRNQIHRLYVHGADSTNSRTVTHANLTGRRSILEKLRAKKGRLMHMQPETGFRESYRIEGETLITVNDYTVVPEPTSSLLIGLGCLSLFRRNRR